MGLLRKTLALLAAAMALASTPPAALAALPVELESETFLRVFSQETPSGSEETGLPAYEYLRADLGGEGTLTAHLYGWARRDFGGYYDPAGTGELLYAYVEYANRSPGGLRARLGRQYLFGGPSNESLDGVWAGGGLTDWLAWTAYAGLPVEVEAVDGRSGDSLLGASLTGRLGSYLSLTAAYQQLRNDSDKQKELLSLDALASPFDHLSLVARGVYNNEADEWQERYLRAPVWFGPVTLTPFYQKFLYDALFSTGKDTSAPFARPLGGLPPFSQSGEEVRIAGAEASVEAGKGLTLGAAYKDYDYLVRSDSARFYSLLASLGLGGGVTVGGEAGSMDGGNARDRYGLLRLYSILDSARYSLTADLVYAKYGEKVYGSAGSDYSLYVSLGGAVNLPGEGRRVKCAIDYASDPNYKRDLRALVALEVRFAR